MNWDKIHKNVLLGQGAVYRNFKNQLTVILFSMESEYVALFFPRALLTLSYFVVKSFPTEHKKEFYINVRRLIAW